MRLKNFFITIKKLLKKQENQLDWSYEDTAFPYEIKETEEGKGKWFYLHSNHERYNLMVIGIDKEIVHDENDEEKIQTYIQITLTEQSTHGDKGKANEFCKFLAKKLMENFTYSTGESCIIILENKKSSYENPIMGFF